MEKAGEPGSAKHGNFINYYGFNPPQRRIELIPAGLLRQSCPLLVDKGRVLGLDIGCNSGDLTQALYDHLTVKGPLLFSPSVDPSAASCQNLQILGIDLDPTLIERCSDHNHPSLSFSVCDVMTERGRSIVIEEYLRNNAASLYDVVFAFSITMWIHLNHGDEGLRGFLRYLSSITTYLLVEPQTWRCYVSAERRMRKLDCQPFVHFKGLEWRENVEADMVEYLEKSCAMRLVERFGRTDWNRSLLLFVSVTSC